MRLDGGGRTAQRRDAFDHVGIKRALRQELRALDLLRLTLEDIDEGAADDLALALGILDALEASEEQGGRIGVDERNVVVAAKQRDDFIGLARAHQTGVDENAGELIADRFMDQKGRDR